MKKIIQILGAFAIVSPLVNSKVRVNLKGGMAGLSTIDDTFQVQGAEGEYKDKMYYLERATSSWGFLKGGVVEVEYSEALTDRFEGIFTFGVMGAKNLLKNQDLVVRDDFGKVCKGWELSQKNKLNFKVANPAFMVGFGYDTMRYGTLVFKAGYNVWPLIASEGVKFQRNYVEDLHLDLSLRNKFKGVNWEVGWIISNATFNEGEAKDGSGGKVIELPEINNPVKRLRDKATFRGFSQHFFYFGIGIDLKL